MRPSPARLLEAADALPEDLTDVRKLLEEIAEAGSARGPDPRERARLLQLAWRMCCPMLKATPAALWLAQQWQAHEPSNVPPVPCSAADYFDRLDNAGHRRIAARQILTDLQA